MLNYLRLIAVKSKLDVVIVLRQLYIGPSADIAYYRFVRSSFGVTPLIAKYSCYINSLEAFPSYNTSAVVFYNKEYTKLLKS